MLHELLQDTIGLASVGQPGLLSDPITNQVLNIKEFKPFGLIRRLDWPRDRTIIFRSQNTGRQVFITRAFFVLDAQPSQDAVFSFCVGGAYVLRNIPLSLMSYAAADGPLIARLQRLEQELLGTTSIAPERVVNAFRPFGLLDRPFFVRAEEHLWIESFGKIEGALHLVGLEREQHF